MKDRRLKESCSWQAVKHHRRLFPFAGFACLLIVVLHIPCSVSSQDLTTTNPYKVKAAFLLNFSHYVNWPEKAFLEVHSPWQICILGKDPFGLVLDKTFEGRTERGRPFTIHRASTLGKLPNCQIIYIAYDDPAKRRAALFALKEQPVLTVGEAIEFLWEGGIVQFQEEERIKFNMNLDQAQTAGLAIRTALLEVATAILHDGILRPRK